MKKSPPTSDDFLPGVFDQDDLDAIATDAAFPLVPHDLDTEYRCPSCSFEWSGVPKPAQEVDVPVPTHPSVAAAQPSKDVTPRKEARRPAAPQRPPTPTRPSIPPRPPLPQPTVPDKPTAAPSVPDSVTVSGAPSAPVVAAEPIAMRSSDGIAFNASGLKLDLESRGHKLLTQDGKLLVSEAGRLTESDRIAIKLLKAELLQLADVLPPAPLPLPVPISAQNNTADVSAGVSRPSDYMANTPTDAERSTSAVSFSGVASPGIGLDYRPDEPPDLTGINEIVLNFATTGLNWHAGDRPVGVTVSTLDGQLTRFLPFAFKGGGNLDEAAIKRWAQEQLRGKKITNSKTKFDIHHAREWGVDLEAQGCTFSDVQHTAALLDDHRKRFALDVLAADYLKDVPVVARLDETQHAEYHAGEAAARERYTAQTVSRLVAAMYPEIDAQELRQVHDLEDAVIPTVVEMERNGSPLNMELLQQYHAECGTRHDALIWEICKECGFAFDHTPKGWQRLFQTLGLPPTDGNAEAIINEIDHPLVKKAHLAAQYASLDSKTFKAYLEAVDSDGVLRFEINQLRSDEGGTVSGRFSIGLVQQVPNEGNHSAVFGDELFPRRLFIPGNVREAEKGSPRSEWVTQYLEADAAQIEFRLLVHYSQNAKLLQAYADDPEMSFHKQMQTMLVAYKPDMQYGHTKNYNFASQYGAKSIKLAVMMGFITEKEGTEIRTEQRWDDPKLKTIKSIEAAYAKAHPEAGALLDYASHLMKNTCDKYCKKGDTLHRQHKHRGYVKTLLGRRSRCVNNYKPYIGLNRVLQGTGADIMKQKLVELHAMRRETGFILRITNHDAALGDATTPETLAKVSAILNRQSFDLKVPIIWKCGTGRNWSEC